MLRAISRGLDRLLPSGRLRRAVAVVAGGHGLAQLIVVGTTPVIARLYDPADFGAYGVGTSLVFVAVTVSCLMYDQPVTVPRSDETAADLVLLALLAAVAMTLLSGLGLLLGGEELLDVLGAPELWPYAWILLLAQLGGAVYLACNALAVRRRDFRGMALARVGQSVSMVAAQIVAGLAGAGGPGLLGGDALGRVAAGGRLALRGARDLREAFASSSAARLAQVARRYRRFPLVGTWPALMNTAGQAAPILLMVALYGPRVGGLYAFGNRLVGAPMSLLVKSVGDVYMSEAATRAGEGRGALKALYRRTLRRMARSAAPLVLLAIPASFLVAPIFGEAWREAGTYIAILTPMWLAQVIASPFGGTLVVIERQDLWLVRELIRVGLVTAAIVAAATLDVPATGAVVAISLAGTCAYLVYGAITWYGVTVHEERRATVAG